MRPRRWITPLRINLHEIARSPDAHTVKVDSEAPLVEFSIVEVTSTQRIAEDQLADSCLALFVSDVVEIEPHRQGRRRAPDRQQPIAKWTGGADGVDAEHSVPLGGAIHRGHRDIRPETGRSSLDVCPVERVTHRHETSDRRGRRTRPSIRRDRPQQRSGHHQLLHSQPREAGEQVVS